MFRLRQKLGHLKLSRAGVSVAILLFIGLIFLQIQNICIDGIDIGGCHFIDSPLGAVTPLSYYAQLAVYSYLAVLIITRFKLLLRILAYRPILFLIVTAIWYPIARIIFFVDCAAVDCPAPLSRPPSDLYLLSPACCSEAAGFTYSLLDIVVILAPGVIVYLLLWLRAIAKRAKEQCRQQRLSYQNLANDPVFQLFLGATAMSFEEGGLPASAETGPNANLFSGKVFLTNAEQIKQTVMATIVLGTDPHFTLEQMHLETGEAIGDSCEFSMAEAVTAAHDNSDSPRTPFIKLHSLLT